MYPSWSHRKVELFFTYNYPHTTRIKSVPLAGQFQQLPSPVNALIMSIILYGWSYISR
jgi:hypothetical protein